MSTSVPSVRPPFARTVEMPLGGPPRLAALGVGIHGIQHGMERYQIDTWCLHLYTYPAELVIDDVVFPLRPGTVSLIPPRCRLEYRYRGRSRHLYCHFFTEDLEPRITVPLVQQYDDSFEALFRSMEEAIGYFSSQPERAAVRMWDILWRVSQPQSAHDGLPNAPLVISRALHSIETTLNQPLRVRDLAREAGLSHNHFLRLFRRTTGDSVVEYIKKRRIERARHLLENSTLPLKVIADQCGLGDSHAFNKAIRRALGCPPRDVRGTRQMIPPRAF